MLLERAIGMKKIEYLKAYNFLGHPVVETRGAIPRADAVWRRGHDRDAGRRGCGRSSIKLEHRLFLDGALSAEGSETRVWAVRDPGNPDAHKVGADPRGNCRAATQCARCRRVT